MRSRRAFTYSIFLLLALAALSAKGCDDLSETGDGSDSDCEGDIVEFADESLEQAVRDAIGKPTGMLCTEDVEEIAEFGAPGLGISDLSGIEAMTSLVWLDVSSNQIEDLSPLAGLTSLLTIYLNRNQVTDLTGLDELHSLIWMDLGRNQISDLTPLADLNSLRQLYLYYNQINDLTPLAGITSILEIEFQNNQITDLAPLVANAGINDGDYIFVEGNPIDEMEQEDNIAALCNRGVVLDPFCDGGEY